MERFRTLGDEYSEPLSWGDKRKVANHIISNTKINQAVDVFKTFVIFTGVPGSGKSTMADFLSLRFGFNSVATDCIKSCLLEREESFVKPDLFHIQTLIFKHFFNMNLNVISDSDSGLSKHRYKLRKVGERYNYNVVNINITYDPEICLRRVVARNSISDRALIERWRRKIYESDVEIQTPRNAFTVDGTGDLYKVQSELLAIFEKMSK